jgi:hypothetical protein
MVIHLKEQLLNVLFHQHLVFTALIIENTPSRLNLKPKFRSGGKILLAHDRERGPLL